MSGQNSLEIGDTRIGWLVDGVADTPEYSCSLSRPEDSIQVTLPYRSIGDPLEARFRESLHPTQGSAFPSAMWFYDRGGVVSLSGCRVLGHSWGNRGGEGRIVCQRAIFGESRVSYEAIHGLRTVVPGLKQWMGVTSLRETINFADDHTIDSMHIELRAPDPVRIARTMNLEIRPTFTFSPSAHGDRTEIIENVYIQSKVKRPREWREHEDLHAGIRELVTVSAWKPFGVSSTRVMRENDPKRVLSGDAAGVNWASAVLAGSPNFPEPTGPIQFLFRYDEISKNGVGRWIKLRNHFRRGLASIIDTALRPETPIESKVTQAAIGLDAIGYQMALDSGHAERQAERESHSGRLRRVYRSVPYLMPFNEEPWVTNASNVYNGVKHANRPEPTFLELLETLRQHQLLTRAWIGSSIGIEGADFQSRLQADPMATPFRIID